MSFSIPHLTKEHLVKQFAELGVCQADTIMVHASLRAVGEILGGPDMLVSALCQALGRDGTIMVYVGCQSPFDDVGRGIYGPEDEDFILNHCPAFEFDAARASRDFGAFAELFRTTKNVICSRNPGARMAAIGSKAEWLVHEHSYDYGLGVGSPLDKLCSAGGKILLIGSDLDAVTVLHYAEAIAPIENKKIVRIKVPIPDGEQRVWREVVEYNSSTGICDWPDGFFAEIVQLYLKRFNNCGNKVGQATTYLLDAKELVEFAVPIMVAKMHPINEQ